MEPLEEKAITMTERNAVKLRAEIERLRTALKNECERCAKVAADMPPTMTHIYDRQGGPLSNVIRATTPADIAAAIRASFRRDLGEEAR